METSLNLKENELNDLIELESMDGDGTWDVAVQGEGNV